MSDNATEQLGAFFSQNTYRLETVIKLLVNKNIITKEEFNKMANDILESKKKQPKTKTDIVDKLKDRVFLK
ncbi:hypothetical protein [Clostridium sp. KNHs214]|uniref:hypothetical protein n=1 Tax=Clostridium sp. KNHs214 TaxID=1540257 RepID=UPI0005539885|nr:hypothetical protein [Clostridium sp. KNHs214]